MTLLAVENATKTFAMGGGLLGRNIPPVHALADVSLAIEAGQSFGLVGESGSGKTTLARCIVGLETLTGGRILFDGVDVAARARRDRMALRSAIQIVFQDPYSSLDPRMRILDIVTEPMLIHRRRIGLGAAARRDRVVSLLERVGLGAQHLHRFPHEFSGGQRQRIAIARALAAEPRLLVLDEPTSALDVSVQAQVLDLLLELQQAMQLTYLFVSHDLGAIRYACEKVAVMQGGRLVESGATETVFDSPREQYTRELVAAVPDLDPDKSLAARLAVAAQ
jgi:ABC-type glutathione transport system ATPase component